MMKVMSNHFEPVITYFKQYSFVDTSRQPCNLMVWKKIKIIRGERETKRDAYIRILNEFFFITISSMT